MRVGLFHVLEYLNGFVRDEQITYRATSHVSAENNIPYYLIALEVPSDPIIVRSTQSFYELSEHHLTVFSAQSPYEGFMSTYHYTGIYINKKTGERVTLRQYLDRSDAPAISPQAWSISTARKKGQKSNSVKINNFFYDQEQMNFFQHIAFAFVSPIITSLRKHQAELLLPFEQQLNQTEHCLVEYSKQGGNDSAFWTHEIKEEFLKNTDAAIALLDSMERYTNFPENIQSKRAFYVQYRECIMKQMTLTAVNEESKLDSISNDIPYVPVSMVTPQKNEQYVELKKMCDELTRFAGLLETNPDLAEQVERYLSEVESSFLKSTFNIPEASQYDILSLLIFAKQQLSTHCLNLLFKNKSKMAQRYYPYLTNIPNDLLINIIKYDDCRVLESLFKEGKLALNTVAIDNDSLTLYELAFEMNSKKCMMFFLMHGVPSIALHGTSFAKLFSKGTLQVNDVLKTYSKMNEMNMMLLENMNTSLLRTSVDNTLIFLKKLKHRYLNKSSKTAHIRSKNEEVKDVTTDQLTTIDLLIEFTTLSDFFVRIIYKNKELFNALYGKGSVTISSLSKITNIFSMMNSLTSINEIQLDVLTPFLDPILALLKKINKNLSKLDSKDIAKLEKLLNASVGAMKNTSLFSMFEQTGMLFSAAALKKFFLDKLKLREADFNPFIEAFFVALNNGAKHNVKLPEQEEIQAIAFSNSELYEVVADPTTGEEKDVLISQSDSSTVLIPARLFTPSRSNPVSLVPTNESESFIQYCAPGLL